MESSRRDLLNDMAESRSILKNNQNTYKPRFRFTRQAGKAFLKTGLCFYYEPMRKVMSILCVKIYKTHIKYSLWEWIENLFTQYSCIFYFWRFTLGLFFSLSSRTSHTYNRVGKAYFNLHWTITDWLCIMWIVPRFAKAPLSCRQTCRSPLGGTILAEQWHNVERR